MKGDSTPQRTRLLEAIIDVAARFGYSGATVARVIKRAGVSRATFYELFDDRGDCFAAAVQWIAAQVESRFQRLERQETSPRHLIANILEGVDEYPAHSCVLLIESLGGPAAARAERERTLSNIQRAMEGLLGHHFGGVRLEISARALSGGLIDVLSTRLYKGERGGMIELLEDLEVWAASYARPWKPADEGVDWRGLGASIEPRLPPQPDPLDARLPRGRSALPPAMVENEHRQRIIAALARLARERGYATTTVADVIATAGVTRETFYGLYRSKQDAFLAAQSFALESSLAIAASRYFSEGSWPERVWSTALSMLSYIASVPDLAVLNFVESYAVGPSAIRRSLEGRMAYTLFLEEGYRQRPEAEALPRICSEAIAGAILELIRHCAVEGRAEEILSVTPQATYLALAPFIGATSALEFVTRKAETLTERSL